MKSTHILLFAALFLLVACGETSTETTSDSTSTENTEEVSGNHSEGDAEETDGEEVEEELEAEVDTREILSLEEWTGGDSEILHQGATDFNNDGMMDQIIILKAEGEDEDAFAEDDRVLMVLEYVDGGGYKLSGKAEHAVMCKGCGGMMGDPVQGVTVDETTPDQFSIPHYGGSRERWSTTLTFGYEADNGRWSLIEKETGVMDTMEPNADEKVEAETHALGEIYMENATYE